ncbi:MAG TPA: molybdopterin-synthase adenylyltransferase MoeB [Rhizobiales bacterium]|nr:molybdopterin-synthase adenylyltransferase MoeB [Hyphomicrobiales bacterium]
MSFSDEELDRYARHIILHDVGGAGQQKLQNARVLVIGAGGLGSPVLMYLAAAGVGTLGIIDDDVVSLSNLQRQIVHRTGDIGIPKVKSAARTLKAINPHVTVNPYQERLSAQNALEILAPYDLVVDGSDNFKTRFLVNDACFFAKKPLVSAAVAQFEGQISTYRAFESDASGTPNPSYRCLLPEAPPPGMVPGCEEAGVLGVLTGIIGTMQGLEVIKEILGIGESLVGKLLIYDALSASSTLIRIPWNPDNPLNGRNPVLHDLSCHEDVEEESCSLRR